MKNSVIILSGGMDSVTLLYDKKEEIALAVTFDYGSNHNKREAEYAKYHCEKLGIEHIVIPLDFIHEYFKSSLLEGAPFRNGIMLSIACGIAESRGLRRVMIANHAGDHAIYPDCRSAFIYCMSMAMQNGTYDNVKIEAPYTEITKTQIAAIGKAIGIDYTKTYSCYKGGEKHCGRCGTCVERKEALRDAGIEDLTEYEN